MANLSAEVILQPLFDRVLIKRVENEHTSPGGIIIPDTAQEKTQIGTVVAVGKGKLLADGKERPLHVKVGDKIIFGKFSGTDIKLNGNDLLIIKEDDILGILS